MGKCVFEWLPKPECTLTYLQIDYSKVIYILKSKDFKTEQCGQSS